MKIIYANTKQQSCECCAFFQELFSLLEHNYFGPILPSLSSYIEYAAICSWYSHWFRCHMLLLTMV